jgi:hypothetical protein
MDRDCAGRVAVAGSSYHWKIALRRPARGLDGDDPEACLVGLGLDIQLSWPHPTHPDDLLQVRTTVQAIEPSTAKPDRGVVTMAVEARNPHGQLVPRVPRVLLSGKPAAAQARQNAPP